MKLRKRRQDSMKIKWTSKFLVGPLLVAGLIFNSVLAVAEDPIPFKAMMQAAGGQAATPPAADANNAASQPAHAGKITAAGKGEMIGGAVLLGAGALAIGFTAAFNSTGFKTAGGKTAALYGGGAAAAGVGVTLIVLGSHRRAKK
jgi:hypothetical protein